MNLALAQLALVFLPGIIWAKLDATYGSGPKVDKPTLALNSFLFGVSTYAMVYLLYSAFSHEFSSTAIQNGSNVQLSDFTDEILFSIPVSFLLAIGWLYSVKFRWVMRFLHQIRATSRFGSEDVWSFTFNSDQRYVEYVDVRDLKNGFIYSGYVNSYSETEDFRELLLRDAIVYDEEGNTVSNPPHLYISMSKQEIWIEFPAT